jgi:hypothetical protein
MLLRGLTGSLGDQFVVRKGKGGTTIISDVPDFDENREFNEKQLAHQQAFQEAIAYARSVKDEELYVAKAMDTTMSSFNAAVADWFKKPQVLEIDTKAWQGAAARPIRIRAKDDTKVVRVHLVISSPDGSLLEEGDAQPAEGLWWTYTANTTVALESNPQVVATAYDRPGNTAEMTWPD